MQLRLGNEELNLVANLLLEHDDKTDLHRILLNKILSRDLALDAEELEALQHLLSSEKHRLRESANHHGDATEDENLEERICALDRALERVDEACAML